MKRIPPKARTGISVGLFLWSIADAIFTIIFYNKYKELWILIMGITLGVIAFIASIVFMPVRSDDVASTTIKYKKDTHKPRKYRKRNGKKPFITDKEWEELEEEEEELMYVDDQ